LFATVFQPVCFLNLPYNTTSDDLRAAFEAYGTVARAQVMSDRETGRSRGFGFVEMETGGEEAIEGLNGADFQGRQLTVNEARPREDRRPGGGGGGGGRRPALLICDLRANLLVRSNSGPPRPALPVLAARSTAINAQVTGHGLSSR
jgi:RNA recognition motif-containing protein